jgi:hypothetical protein
MRCYFDGTWHQREKGVRGNPQLLFSMLLMQANDAWAFIPGEDLDRGLLPLGCGAIC